MNIKKRTGTTIIILFVVIIILAIWWNELGTLFLSSSDRDVDSMVETMMNKSTTPGVAIVISKQGDLEYKCYGYADVKSHKNVDEESLFELGSSTKAFTALAIILLEEEGSIAGSDCITDYISWFVFFTSYYRFRKTGVSICIGKFKF